jgi:hypothetical protein
LGILLFSSSLKLIQITVPWSLLRGFRRRVGLFSCCVQSTQRLRVWLKSHSVDSSEKDQLVLFSWTSLVELRYKIIKSMVQVFSCIYLSVHMKFWRWSKHSGRNMTIQTKKPKDKFDTKFIFCERWSARINAEYIFVATVSLPRSGNAAICS